MKQNETKGQLTVNIQYIKDLSFENQNSPDSLSNKGEAPAINVDINVFAKPLGKRMYEVSLSINSKAEKKDFKVFELELVYSGIFTLGFVTSVRSTQALITASNSPNVKSSSYSIVSLRPSQSISKLFKVI